MTHELYLSDLQFMLLVKEEKGVNIKLLCKLYNLYTVLNVIQHMKTHFALN